MYNVDFLKCQMGDGSLYFRPCWQYMKISCVCAKNDSKNVQATSSNLTTYLLMFYRRCIISSPGDDHIYNNKSTRIVF